MSLPTRCSRRLLGRPGTTAPAYRLGHVPRGRLLPVWTHRAAIATSSPLRREQSDSSRDPEAEELAARQRLGLSGTVPPHSNLTPSSATAQGSSSLPQSTPNSSVSSPSTSPSTTPPDFHPSHTSGTGSNGGSYGSSSARQPKTPRFRFISAAIFLFFGAAFAMVPRSIISPPTPPEPGSHEDRIRVSLIRHAAERLPLVKELTQDPRWESWDAYESIIAPDLAAEDKQSSKSAPPNTSHPRLTSTALRGDRGVGAFQRIFHNPETSEVLSVIHFGSGTCGWPGTVHGGASATILDESLGRCASRHLPASSAGVVTARLELAYRKPVLSSPEDFYLIRSSVVPQEQLPEADRGKMDRKVWVVATMERLDKKNSQGRGTVCVEAKGLFVVPKGGQELRKLHDRF